MNFFIHKTAIVDDGAAIGENTKIWHFSHICEEANLGKNVTVGQNVFISNKVKVGDGCKIQNNVSIYDNVHLEDNVFCGPSMVFTNVLNPRAFVNRKDEYKNTIIKKGASLGANCTIVCGVIVDEYAFIAAGAVVTKDVKKFALMAGMPAKQIGWISKEGNKIDLPLSGNGEFLCKESNEKYLLLNGHLTCE